MSEEKTATLLVVDDERYNTTLVKRALRPHPRFVVVTALSGDGALGLLGRQHFDLLLVDYRMPGITGVALLERAQRMGLNIPSIMVTAFPELEEIQCAMTSGLVRKIIAKPWAAHELVSTIEEVLGSE